MPNIYHCLPFHIFLFINLEKWYFSLFFFFWKNSFKICWQRFTKYELLCFLHRSNALQNTNIQNSAFISPKIINLKAVKRISCIEAQDNHNSEGRESNCCEASVRLDPDSSLSNKQRQAIFITGSPSPAVSVITISSDTDEDDLGRTRSLRE